MPSDAPSLAPDTTRLRYAAAAFGLIWAIGMIWWMGPGSKEPVTTGLVIGFAIGGVIAGLLWYWLMKWFFHFAYGARSTPER